mmetsp:Transcript_43668/g.57865  ORF Transcript_43668/g.57865 Transcript_43668/m.57865 type:complete len:80 (+) Transcript_43668:968-1207(+)
MMARAIEAINSTKFKDLSPKVQDVESCIICFANFLPKDDVSQLNCNERHIFHKACLESWMKSDSTNNTLSCPICRSTMV